MTDDISGIKDVGYPEKRKSELVGYTWGEK